MRPPRALISSTAILTPFAISLPSEAITPPVGKTPTTLMVPLEPVAVGVVGLGASALPATPPTIRPPTTPAPPARTDLRVTSRRVNVSPATFYPPSTDCARKCASLHLVIDLDRSTAVCRRLVDREAHRHGFVGIVDRGVRLDVVLDAVEEVPDLRNERVVGHIAGIRLDGREGPVVERARVVLPREDPIVLDRPLRP